MHFDMVSRIGTGRVFAKSCRESCLNIHVRLLVTIIGMVRKSFQNAYGMLKASVGTFGESPGKVFEMLKNA